MTQKVTRIVVRNGTEAEWSPGTAIAKLGVGEIGYELDTNKVKIGHETDDNPADADGLVEWDNCAYITDVLGVVDDYANIIELGDDGLIFAEGYDDTELRERIEFLEDEHEIHHLDIELLQEDVIRTGQEIDGGTLLKNELGVMWHFPSIRLKPLALHSLGVLQNTGSAETALQDFLEGILGAAQIPILPVYEYTILAAVPQDIQGVGLTVQLPCTSATYIDWGDGNIIDQGGTPIVGVDLRHTYPAPADPTEPDIYIIKGIFDWDNTSPNVDDVENINKLPWLQQILQFGRRQGQAAARLVTGENAFAGYSGPTFDHDPATAPAFRALDVSNLTSYRRMFYTAREMDSNVNWLYHTGVTDTFRMFEQAGKFNNGGVPIDFTDLTNVTLAGYMFATTAVTDPVMQNLTSWDVSNVTDEPHDHGDNCVPVVMGALRRLLYQCDSLSELDLSGWTYVSHLSGYRNLEIHHTGEQDKNDPDYCNPVTAGGKIQQFFYTQRPGSTQPYFYTRTKLPPFINDIP